MLEKFTKSLAFIGVDTSNMKHSMCDKNIYKFEDEKIDKQWRSFFAFYRDGLRQGRIDTLNEIAADAMQKLNEV